MQQLRLQHDGDRHHQHDEHYNHQHGDRSHQCHPLAPTNHVGGWMACAWCEPESSTPNTPQTPGMSRAAAITYARVGAEKLWAGTVTIHPKAKTGPHHHGHVESVIYVLKGKARMRWGERLQFMAEADAGDF